MHAIPSDQRGLYTPRGERKYLTADERQRLLDAAGDLPDHEALFVQVLFWTGARISEVLALTRGDILLTEGAVALRTLKQRRFRMREVPLPDPLLKALVRAFGLTCDVGRAGRLWPWCRCTAWRLVHGLMQTTALAGPSATPRGLRHSFAVAALQSGVPISFVQRWLGHSRMETTAIYSVAIGPEEREIAARMWRTIYVSATCGRAEARAGLTRA